MLKSVTDLCYFHAMSARTPADIPSPGSVPAVPGFFSVGEVVDDMQGLCQPSARVRTRRPIEAAWVSLIQRHDWQWFGTFTFREEVHPESADKLFRLWCARCDESFLGKTWHKQTRRDERMQWVRGLEWQKRGVLHYHALLRNIPAYRDGYDSRLSFSSLWNELAGFAYVVPVEESGGVAAYISKYCAKGGQVDVCANLRAVASPAPQPRLAGL
jgi:hypothetical protein